MTTHRTIASTETDPYAPIVAQLMKALALNPVAITEGSPGAPKIQDDALGATVTAAGLDWVRFRYATQNALTVGTLAILSHQGTAVASFTPGASIAGSSLISCGLDGNLQGPSPGGTWLLLSRISTNIMGTIPSTSSSRIGLWLRTA